MIVVCWLLVVGLIRVFAFCQVLLGWRTYKYYYETDELPNPRSTQPKKNWVKKWHLGHFFSHSKHFFVGWDWCYVGNRLQETQPNQVLRKHPDEKQKWIVNTALTQEPLQPPAKNSRQGVGSLSDKYHNPLVRIREKGLGFQHIIWRRFYIFFVVHENVYTRSCPLDRTPSLSL